MATRSSGRRGVGARAALAGLVAALLAAPAPLRADDDLTPAFDARETYRIPASDGRARGPVDALVTIVEFSDFTCQFCRLASETVAELQRLYPRDVRLVYRHSLLDPEDGTQAAEAAEAAAAQGRFWAFHDRLFAERGRIDRTALERAAREIGLDLPRFRRDLDGARFRSAVRDDNREAAELGVLATPIFFINGRPLVGSHGLGSFIDLVEEQRARAAALVKRGLPRQQVYERVTARGLPSARPIRDGGGQVPDRELDPSTIYPAGVGEPAQRLGSDAALVTVVEFGDFRCGYCAVVNPTLAELKAQYGDDLRLVFRHMPLAGNPESRRLAEVAAAAGEQGRFWAMHGRLFAADGALDRKAILDIAADIGLDVARFRAALDRRRFAEQVSRDAAEAARLGVRGTPTFFINGTPIVGAASAEMFRAVIDRKQREALDLVKRGVPRAEVYGRVTSQKSGSAVKSRQ
jgi:protein-disulfide isomerase